MCRSTRAETEKCCHQVTAVHQQIPSGSNNSHQQPTASHQELMCSKPPRRNSNPPRLTSNSSGRNNDPLRLNSKASANNRTTTNQRSAHSMWVRNFPQQIQDCVRNKPASKYPMAKISRREVPPSPPCISSRPPPPFAQVKQSTESCDDDQRPVSRGCMRVLYPLLMALAQVYAAGLPPQK